MLSSTWAGFLGSLEAINNKYSAAISALTPIVLGLASFFYFKIYKDSKLKEGDAALIVKPTFWKWPWNAYKIYVIHKYTEGENSRYSGSEQIDTPNELHKLIDIKSSCPGLRFKIVPKNNKDILLVLISRNGKENWRQVRFNMDY